MENQLIVYTPKKNVKKMITTILLVILISFLIFLLSAISSTAICVRIKWNEPVRSVIGSSHFYFLFLTHINSY